MGHRQKGKGSKRRKSWHRGRGEADRWRRRDLPRVELDEPVDYGAAAPVSARGRWHKKRP